MPLHVLSHEEEAYLTIIGVTEGLPVTHETLVVDVGGGSSEFCIVDATRRPRAAGLQLGSARLTDRFATARSADRRRGRRDARRRGRGHPGRAGRLADRARRRRRHGLEPGQGAARGDRRPDPDPGADRGDPGDPRDASRPRPRPSATASTRSGRGSCRPVARSSTRSWSATARTAIRVSEAGLREGVILAVEHGGPCWRDRLRRPRPRLADVAPRPTPTPTYSPATTRPSVRRKVTPATPRHGVPIVRRRRATSRSRLTR